MTEAYVQLLCPECDKDWESTATDLPAHDDTFHCPNCYTTRRMVDYLRTDDDLETLKVLQG